MPHYTHRYDTATATTEPMAGFTALGTADNIYMPISERRQVAVREFVIGRGLDKNDASLPFNTKYFPQFMTQLHDWMGKLSSAHMDALLQHLQENTVTDLNTSVIAKKLFDEAARTFRYLSLWRAGVPLGGPNLEAGAGGPAPKGQTPGSSGSVSPTIWQRRGHGGKSEREVTSQAFAEFYLMHHCGAKNKGNTTVGQPDYI